MRIASNIHRNDHKTTFPIMMPIQKVEPSKERVDKTSSWAESQNFIIPPQYFLFSSALRVPSYHGHSVDQSTFSSFRSNNIRWVGQAEFSWAFRADIDGIFIVNRSTRIRTKGNARFPEQRMGRTDDFVMIFDELMTISRNREILSQMQTDGKLIDDFWWNVFRCYGWLLKGKDSDLMW